MRSTAEYPYPACPAALAGGAGDGEVVLPMVVGGRCWALALSTPPTARRKAGGQNCHVR